MVKKKVQAKVKFTMDSLQKGVDKATKLLIKEGGKIHKKLLTDFVKNNPEVAQVVWVQYTPGFNDGDPCTFDVGEICLKLTQEAKKDLLGEDLDDDTYEDVISNPWDSDDYYLDESNKKRAKEIKEAFNLMIKKGFNDIVLEGVYGDGSKITASKSGIVVESYSEY